MIWLLFIPVVIFFTAKNLLVDSNFPEFGDDKRNFLDWVFALFVTVFLSAVISMVPVGIGMIIGSNSAVEIERDQDYPLVALRVKDGAVGSFFLASGTLRGDEYYFWYVRNPDGSVAGGRTHRDTGVDIFEGNYEPIMRTYHQKYKSDLTKQYGWLYGIDVRDPIRYSPTFFIPQGSIDKTVKVDQGNKTMTTANDLYQRRSQDETYSLYQMFGHRYNHFKELCGDDYWIDESVFKDQNRIKVKTLKHFDFDGRRYWNMSTVWLDDKPFMVTHNAGREGDDSTARFITHPDLFVEAVAYLKTFMPIEQSTIDQDVVPPDEPIQIDFYGNHLDGHFERYHY